MRPITVLLVAATLMFGLPGAAAARGEAPRNWIVQLREGASVGTAVTSLRDRFGVRAGHRFSQLVRGYAAVMTPAQADALRHDPNVVAVVPDGVVGLAGDPQPAPPGVTRVGANPSAVYTIDGNDAGLDVDIAVLDTGVAGHPDLNLQRSHNCTTSSSAGDGHGHGTHVAGTAAGRDNDFGVVGVAPGARIWNVKVIGDSGWGLESWLICGLDWVAAQREPASPEVPLVEVVNMSLSMPGASDGNCGLSNDSLLHQAVCRLNRIGVTIAAAAANNDSNAANYVPAAYEEVITVGAIADYDGLAGGTGSRPSGCSAATLDDRLATFSNYGAPLDLVAPGVCVRSTLPGGYALMSGTSMATPHVAGGAALFYLREAALGRSRPTPEQVLAGLVAAGNHSWVTASYPSSWPAPPLLDVSALDLAADFKIGATPTSQRRAVGETATYDVWLARLGGFEGEVEISLSGAPSGSAWGLGGDPFVATHSGWQRLTVQLPNSGSSATHHIVISATSEGMPTRTAQVTLQFEGGTIGGPGAPRLNLRKNVVTGAASLPARVKWLSVAGAQQYQLQVSRDAGPWSNVSLPSKTALRVNATIWPSSTYQYRLRVLKNGTWGNWRTSTPFVAKPYAVLDGQVQRSGTWSAFITGKTYSEVSAYASKAGARVRLDFSGRSVNWIASRGPKRGKAAVYIDGKRVATVDLYSSSVVHRRVVFVKSWATPGVHSIAIEVLGSAGRPRIDVDAIVVVSPQP